MGALPTCDDRVCEDAMIEVERKHRVRRVRRRPARRARVRVGAPDESLTRFSGLAAVTELVERLGVIKRLDAAVGPIKTRDRGSSAG
jgi:hypothetical protein